MSENICMSGLVCTDPPQFTPNPSPVAVNKPQPKTSGPSPNFHNSRPKRAANNRPS